MDDNFTQILVTRVVKMFTLSKIFLSGSAKYSTPAYACGFVGLCACVGVWVRYKNVN